MSSGNRFGSRIDNVISSEAGHVGPIQRLVLALVCGIVSCSSLDHFLVGPFTVGFWSGLVLFAACLVSAFDVLKVQGKDTFVLGVILVLGGLGGFLRVSGGGYDVSLALELSLLLKLWVFGVAFWAGRDARTFVWCLRTLILGCIAYHLWTLTLSYSHMRGFDPVSRGLIAVFSLFLLVGSIRNRWGFRLFGNTLFEVGLCFGLAFIAISSGTRVAVYGGLVALGVMFPMPKMLRTLVLMVLVMGVALGLTSGLMRARSGAQVARGEAMLERIDSARPDIYSHSVDLIKENPWGLGFSAVSERLQIETFGNFKDGGLDSHNSFLHIILGVGWVSVPLLLYLVGLWIIRVRAYVERTSDWVLASAFVLLGIASQFHNMLNVKYYWIVVGLLLGWMSVAFDQMPRPLEAGHDDSGGGRTDANC